MNYETNEESEKVIAFEGKNTMAYTKMIGGALLFIFLLILMPGLLDKYYVDSGFVLKIGGAFLFSIISIISGYASMNSIILVVAEKYFQYMTGKIETQIQFENVKDIEKVTPESMVIVHLVEGKTQRYEFKNAFLKKEIRHKARQTIIRAFELSKLV